MKYVQTGFSVIDLLGETYQIPRLSASALINQLIQTEDRKLLSSQWQIVLVELVFICNICAREQSYIFKQEFMPLVFNIKGFPHTVSIYLWRLQRHLTLWPISEQMTRTFWFRYSKHNILYLKLTSDFGTFLIIIDRSQQNTKRTIQCF